MSTAASAAKVRIIHAEPTQLPCCSALDGPRLGFAHPKNCTRIDTEKPPSFTGTRQRHTGCRAGDHVGVGSEGCAVKVGTPWPRLALTPLLPPPFRFSLFLPFLPCCSAPTELSASAGANLSDGSEREREREKKKRGAESARRCPPRHWRGSTPAVTRVASLRPSVESVVLPLWLSGVT